jgi:hypothetical protein
MKLTDSGCIVGCVQITATDKVGNVRDMTSRKRGYFDTVDPEGVHFTMSSQVLCVCVAI